MTLSFVFEDNAIVNVTATDALPYVYLIVEDKISVRVVGVILW